MSAMLSLLAGSSSSSKRDDALFPSFLLFNQDECPRFSTQGLAVITPDTHAARGVAQNERSE